jgi:hypothetical protein
MFSRSKYLVVVGIILYAAYEGVANKIKNMLEKLKHKKIELKESKPYIRDGGKWIDFDAVQPKHVCFFCNDWFHFPIKNCKCK